MSLKEQTRSNDKRSVKPRLLKPATEKLDIVVQQQPHPAAIIQRARLDLTSLNSCEVLQLQRSIGNQAVGRLFAQTAQQQPLQNKENDTGLPDKLKAGIENHSGLSMDDGQLHDNSDKLAEVQALPFTNGTDIPGDPGQKQRLYSAPGPLQRTVNLNGETNPANIWPQVTNWVQSRYKRKQTLIRWAGDSITRNYTDAQTLANDLDTANAKGGMLGRGRPAFSSKLTAIFNQTQGGAWHRRHIVMSSLMRDAVYATTEANIASNGGNLLIAYNHLVGLAGGPPVTTIPQAEANLVYILHNNPANLVIDQGDWNSAIGAFAHNVKAKLDQDQTVVFQEYKLDRRTFFGNLVQGFQPHIQQQIAAFWENFEEPTDVSEFTDLLETMYDNAAFDLMSNKAMPQQQNLTTILMKTHGLFVAAASSGDLNTLVNACTIYINTGTSIGALVGNKSVYYKDIL